MLVLTRKMQESIRIDDNITITILGIEGGRVKIGIQAPREIPVVRSELPTEGERQELTGMRQRLASVG